MPLPQVVVASTDRKAERIGLIVVLERLPVALQNRGSHLVLVRVPRSSEQLLEGRRGDVEPGRVACAEEFYVDQGVHLVDRDGARALVREEVLDGDFVHVEAASEVNRPCCDPLQLRELLLGRLRRLHRLPMKHRPPQVDHHHP